MPPNYAKIKLRRKKAAERRKQFQERVAKGEVADEYKTIYNPFSKENDYKPTWGEIQDKLKRSKRETT